MYRRPKRIKVTAVLSQKSKLFTSMEDVEKSTGITIYILRQIKKGKMSNLVRGNKDILFLIEFLYDKAVTLTPAWDTANDGAVSQDFSSHYSAMKFLGCSMSTYYRRMREQPIGDPCHTPLKDSFNREWIAIFHTKGDFNENKKGE